MARSSRAIASASLCLLASNAKDQRPLPGVCSLSTRSCHRISSFRFLDISTRRLSGVLFVSIKQIIQLLIPPGRLRLGRPTTADGRVHGWFSIADGGSPSPRYDGRDVVR